MTDDIVTSQNGMLRRDVVIVTHVPTNGDLRSLARSVHEHHDFVAGLERQGPLFLAGPLLSAAGALTGASLWILDGADCDAARAVAAGDPYVADGVRSIDVQRWRINMGAIGLRLTCSDQTFTLGS